MSGYRTERPKMNASLLRNLVCAGILCLASACSTVDKDFTARTIATYKNAGTEVNYNSSKNQENFKADVEFDAAGKVTKLHVETTATTPEAAITAAANAQAQALKLANDALQALLPLVKAAATKVP